MFSGSSPAGHRSRSRANVSSTTFMGRSVRVCARAQRRGARPERIQHASATSDRPTAVSTRMPVAPESPGTDCTIARWRGEPPSSLL